MKEGQIVITSIQQADGQRKLRPVLLLKQMPSFGDWLVCGISTHLEHEVKKFDFIIEQSNPVFKATGLKKSSLIRLGFLAVLPDIQISGTIGYISFEIYNLLISNLVMYLQN